MINVAIHIHHIINTKQENTLWRDKHSQLWIYLESRRLPVLTSRPIKEAASGWIVLVDGKMNWLKDIVWWF